jgi:hypothetical protein
MRTTVDIPDAVYRKLKSRAVEQGCSVKELILRGLERELKPASRVRRRIRLPIVRSRQPGSLQITSERIYELVPFP